MGSEDLLSCWLDINGTTYSMTLSPTTNASYSWVVPAHGNYTLRAYCNDTANNTGNTTIAWYKLDTKIHINVAKTANEPAVLTTELIDWTILVENQGLGPINITLVDSNGQIYALANLLPGNNATVQYNTTANCSAINNTVNVTAINHFGVLQANDSAFVNVTSCGNGICDCGEDFSTCSLDCPSTKKASCDEPWICSGWSVCNDGIMTRTCDCDCGDKSKCTGNSTTVVSCVCSVASDCPKIACKEASCSGDECQYTNLPDGTLCDDEDKCTIGDSCKSGMCLSSENICILPGDTNGVDIERGSTGVVPPGEDETERPKFDEETKETAGEQLVSPGQRVKSSGNELIDFITSPNLIILIIILLVLSLLFWKKKKKNEKITKEL